jgi:hypothetical protein
MPTAQPAAQAPWKRPDTLELHQRSASGRLAPLIPALEHSASYGTSLEMVGAPVVNLHTVVQPRRSPNTPTILPQYDTVNDRDFTRSVSPTRQYRAREMAPTLANPRPRVG